MAEESTYESELLDDESLDYDVETLSVVTDCTNTWNIATKSSVMETLSSHDDDLLSHESVVIETSEGISKFVEESGEPVLHSLFDAYNSIIYSNGSVVKLGTDCGGVLISSDRDMTFETIKDGVSDLRNSTTTALSSLENTVSAGSGISIDGVTVSLAVNQALSLSQPDIISYNEESEEVVVIFESMDPLVVNFDTFSNGVKSLRLYIDDNFKWDSTSKEIVLKCSKPLHINCSINAIGFVIYCDKDDFNGFDFTIDKSINYISVSKIDLDKLLII